MAPVVTQTRQIRQIEPKTIVDKTLIEPKKKIYNFVFYDFGERSREIKDSELLKLAEKSKAFNFLAKESENIYSLKDGTPINEK